MASVRERLSSVIGHLTPSSPTSEGKVKLLQKNPDDIVITYAARTPLTKARKGGLKDTRIDDLLITLLEILREKSKIDPSLVEDVCLGNVLAESQGYVARASVLAAGFPITTAASVANRFCSSGLLAVQQIANQIIAGSIDVGIAVGAESMSTCPDNGAPTMSSRITEHPIGKQNLLSMGQTSENVAEQFHITREAHDAFAAKSFQKAEIAQKAGWFADEIVPITVKVIDPTTGVVTEKVIDRDDGPRYGTTAASLSKIRTAFPQWPPSATTGGNASQITDGAAAILLMKRSKALELGQPIVGKFCGATVIGLEPRIMGIGPSYAIPKILGKVGLSIQDVDVFEINEAFASMGVYCVEKLGLDPAKVNPRGGAIIAVTSMCVGTVSRPPSPNTADQVVDVKLVGTAHLDFEFISVQVIIKRWLVSRLRELTTTPGSLADPRVVGAATTAARAQFRLAALETLNFPSAPDDHKTPPTTIHNEPTSIYIESYEMLIASDQSSGVLRCTRELPACKRCKDLSTVCDYPPPPDRKLLAAQRWQNAKARAHQNSGTPQGLPAQQRLPIQERSMDGQTPSNGLFIHKKKLSVHSATDTDEEPNRQSEPGNSRIQKAITPIITSLQGISYPSTELAEMLIEIYFSHLMNSTLTFHKKTFLSDFAAKRTPEFVNLSVFALATVFLRESIGPRRPELEHSSIDFNKLPCPTIELCEKGRDWATAANYLTLTQCDIPRLESIQACQNLTLYWFSSGESSRTDIHSSIAWKTAEILRLNMNKNSVKYLNNSERLEVEIERRCFWAAWIGNIVDQGSNSIRGFAWKEVSGLPLPSDEESYAAGIPRSNNSFDDNGNIKTNDSENAPIKLSPFAGLANLFSIWVEIRTFVRVYESAKPDRVPEMVSAFFELDAKLHLALEHLDPTIRYSNVAAFTSPKVNPYLLFWWHGLYRLCACTLHSFLVPLFSNKPTPSQQTMVCS
ncbi:hypothetical protein G7Y89_g6167 [Cudoniella acicularis]|uniref:Transcription factor domain-containing protein n=1 Tax=Cudoniella acicularis TaxID=354080 RepID=A0A8H4W345_9HELO|nr:hypothetical protein G7Y89_g6167 [Cudoniella acicularis]